MSRRYSEPFDDWRQIEKQWSRDDVAANVFELFSRRSVYGIVTNGPGVKGVYKRIIIRSTFILREMRLLFVIVAVAFDYF